MDLTLTRTEYRPDGVFGVLSKTETGEQVAVTLEHAYSKVAKYYTKVDQGVYTCVRGEHTLHHDPTPFETFEIMDVLGHSDILFHVGNYNEDSDGCVLLGYSTYDQPHLDSEGDIKYKMLTGSRQTFGAFMQLQEGIDQFTLTVKDA